MLTAESTGQQSTILKGADRDKVSAKAVRKELQVRRKRWGALAVMALLT